ncbi:hypothetical protein ACQJBY_068457 [Aegilops geniculata]
MAIGRTAGGGRRDPRPDEGMGADLPPPAPSHRRRHHRPDLHHDPSHHLAADASSRAELWEESLRKAAELAQAVANALFSLPATKGCDGPVVHLPIAYPARSIYQGKSLLLSGSSLQDRKGLSRASGHGTSKLIPRSALTAMIMLMMTETFPSLKPN